MPYELLAATFEDGDIIYGLDQCCEDACEAVVAAGHRDTLRARVFYLGCIPGAVVIRRNILMQRNLTNAVWNPWRADEYRSTKDIAEDLYEKNRGKAFREFLKRHDRYNVADQNYEVSVGAWRKAWSRTSKAGLEFQVRRGRTVHYLMDGVMEVLDQVAGKFGFGRKGMVTSLELRWLYRHRHLEEVRNHLRFWLVDREVSQEEVFNDPRWEAYRPRRTYEGWPNEIAIKAALRIIARG